MHFQQFLAPFQKLALEVDFFVGNLVQIDEFLQDALLYKLLATSIPFVQIDGAHYGLKSIAAEVAVVVLGVFVTLDKFVESQIVGYLPKSFSLYNPTAGVGQESFVLVGKVFVHDVSYYRIENGVSEKLQPFVALEVVSSVVIGVGFMCKCLLV